MSTALLLTCHGTVNDVSEIPGFLANIRRGRPTPAHVIEEVTSRFQQIGGSPLMRITAAQAEALGQRLGLPAYFAARLWHPYPSEVLAKMAADGVTRVLSLPLAPQSVDIYHASVREAAAAHPSMEVLAVPAWGSEPLLIDAFVEAIDEALARFPEAERAGVSVVLTAHSLPQRIIAMGDPYEAQFREMAALVATRLEARGNPTCVAFQSQGMTGDAWLGPDLPTTFDRLVAEGKRDVVVAPIGFLAEHVETLYDIDIEAQAMALEKGLARLERMPALDTRASFVDALEAVARRALGDG